jgi:hypothetical protein
MEEPRQERSKGAEERKEREREREEEGDVEDWTRAGAIQEVESNDSAWLINFIRLDLLQ